MSNLRQMIDGVGSLRLNVKPTIKAAGLEMGQSVIIKRSTNRSGPKTSQVIVGTLLSMADGRAVVSVNKPGNVTQRMSVNVNELQPATASFKRNSVQFSPVYRGRV